MWVRARSLDADFKQHGHLGREYFAKSGVEILAALDADAFDSLTQGQRAEIDMRQPHPGKRLDVEVPPELFECAIARIVDDDEGHGKAKLGRAPKPLDRIHRGAVAEQSDHLASRPSQRDARRL